MGKGIQKRPNLVFSPYVLYLSLLLLYEGARGSSEDELKSILNLKDENYRILIKDYIKYVRDRSRYISPSFISNNYKLGYHDVNMPDMNDVFDNQRRRDIYFHFTNSIYIDKKFPIIDDYIKVVKQSYYSHVKNLYFDGSKEVIDKLNLFAASHSNHQIVSYLSSKDVSTATAGIAVSMVAFIGVWLIPFIPSETWDVGFWSSWNKLIKVPMMKIVESTFNYCEDSMVSQ